MGDYNRIFDLCEDDFGPMVRYGIFSDSDSTHQVHVCPKVGYIYLFEKAAAIKAYIDGHGRVERGWTNIIATPSDPSFCPIHGITMKKWSKNGRSWYSHLTTTNSEYHNNTKREWCNGRLEVITALGRNIPPRDIDGIKEISIPLELLEKYKIKRYDKTGVKGQKATRLFAAMMRQGLVPIPMQVEEVNTMAEQIRGVDLTTGQPQSIEVKLDYRGGPKKRGGIGFLYIQEYERNIFKQH